MIDKSYSGSADEKERQYERFSAAKNNPPSLNNTGASRAKNVSSKSKKVYKAIGALVIAFAIVGVVLSVWMGISFVKKNFSKKEKLYNEYNAFLTPVAAVDLGAFDEIVNADNSQLLDCAVWSILKRNTTPDRYRYSDGFLLIPEQDVLKAFTDMFGSEAAAGLTMTSVSGYDYKFTYDPGKRQFKIPVTTINPIFTPRVSMVKKTGDTITVTVQYLGAGSWSADSFGNMTAPEPVKTMKAVFRSVGGKYYLSALRLVSRSIPEALSTSSRAPASEKPTEKKMPETSSASTTTGAGVRIGGDVRL